MVLESDNASSIGDIARLSACTARYVRKIVPLGFMAPNRPKRTYSPASGKIVPEAPSPPCGYEHILLVDDEENILIAVKWALERLGYRVTAINDGIVALEDFRANPQAYDLLISDQTMPKMTGLELARETAKIRPDLPVVLMSGYSESMIGSKALSTHIRKFLVKPISPEELGQAVQEALETRVTPTP